MNSTFGLLLELKSPKALLDAVKLCRDDDIRPLDAFSPFPVEGLSEAMEIPPSRIPWIMLYSGIFGGLLSFGTMTYSAVWHYPFNVGGRPLFSWPSFIPITFELTILFAALGGAFSLALLSHLPRLYHPVFNDRRFRDSMQGGFFLLLPDTLAARQTLIKNFPDAWEEVKE